MARRVTVSQVVESVYCEQKVLLTERFGRARSQDDERKAAAGTRAHQRFEVEGLSQAPMVALKRAADRRCYIATAVFTEDAWETEALRQWRDRALLTNRAGRAFVRIYYAVSPPIARFIDRVPAVRFALRAALRRLATHVARSMP